jgi:uncharacterized protein DUF927
MSVAQFLSSVLPAQGARFGLVTFGVQGTPEFRPVQKHFPEGDVTEVMNFAAWGSSKGGNAYFAVAGFEIVLNEHGKAQRLASAAQYHRCLRLDIDVGANKPYTEKRDACIAALEFVAHYQMPQPWMIDSGGGVHVYWAFDRDVGLGEWLQAAGRLRAACEQFGLQADSTTTTDAARVLRVPDTLNHKNGQQRPVRILCAGVTAAPDQIVRALPAAAPIYTNAAVPAALRGQVSELQANLHQPYFMRGVLSACPGMAAMVGDGGARAQEPLWKAALDLINKSDESYEIKERVARGISVGHKDFDEGTFRRKWSQTQEQNYHPPTCSRMAAAGMPECATCPLRGKISSPLVMGRPQPQLLADDAVVPPAPVAPAAALVEAPAPMDVAIAAPMQQQYGVFLFDTQGTVVRVVDGPLTSKLQIKDGMPVQEVIKDNDDGTKQHYLSKIINYKITEIERLLDTTGHQSLVVMTFDARTDGIRKVLFDQGDFSEPRSFFKKMTACGLHVSARECKNFLEVFMPPFLSQLQNARAANQIASRCGWTERLDGFVLGTSLYRANGSVSHIRPGSNPGEMEAYKQAGSEAAWREAFDIVLAGGPDRQAVVALALATPLMVFTGLDGVLLNAYSPESGVGKSTLCDAALSIWGEPNVLRKDFRDTVNATFKIASITGNMPMVIDEFTNVEGKALSDYVYTVTQGREKHRLTADAKLNASSQRWCLAAITTANNSIHDKLQAYRADATAEAARVFEIRLHPLNVDPAKMGDIKEKLQALRYSYGFLGPKLVHAFLAKAPEYWRDAVTKRIAKWDRDVSRDAGDRFRSATCALIEVGAALGKAMGYNFDLAGIDAELRRHWGRQVIEFEAERKGPREYVVNYITKYLGEFAMIGGPNGDSMMNTGARRWMGEMRGRSVSGGFKAEKLMIPLDLLRDWIREQNGNYKSVQEWIQTQQGALVSRAGELIFLEGQTHQITTPAVEFHAAVVGATLLSKLNPNGADQ